MYYPKSVICRYHLVLGFFFCHEVLLKNNLQGWQVCGKFVSVCRYMSQAFRCMTVRSERDREERILDNIRSHRLYEQARACMPTSMTQTVGITTHSWSLCGLSVFISIFCYWLKEDPWSTLALMLVLADGVGELWQLVVRLRSPLTPEQLSEFLWCSATLLRAMADARVKISNRWDVYKFILFTC